MVASVTTIEGIRTHATSVPLSAPSSAPARHAATPASGVGIPIFAHTPPATLQIANCEPTEISISPLRTISVMPSATISTGMLASKRSLWFSGEKKPGAITASTAISARIAIATEISLRQRCSILPGRTPWSARLHIDAGEALHLTGRLMTQRQRQNLLLRRLVARQDSGDGALVHHRDAVAHAQDLRQFRGDHQDRHALFGQLDNQPVDLGLRSYLDALRRFVEDQQA